MKPGDFQRRKGSTYYGSVQVSVCPTSFLVALTKGKALGTRSVFARLGT